MKIEKPPYGCDLCKKRRDNDTNHWYLLVEVSTDQVQSLTIFRWNDEVAVISNAHACGQEHALTLVSRWLDHGTFEEKA